MQDSKNLILAIVLAVAIIFGFQMFFMPEPPPKGTGGTTQSGGKGAPTTPGGTPPGTAPGTAPGTTPGTAPGAPGTTPGTAPTGATREAALKKSRRVRIETPDVTGSIALTGGLIDDITLKNYKVKIDGTERVHLLQPPGAPKAYYVDFGWQNIQGGTVKTPTSTTVWTADNEVLTPEKPVTLTWTNPDGIKFVRVFSIDKNYMITVKQRVENASGAEISLQPFGFARQEKEPETLGFFILHEGPIMAHRDKAEDDGIIFDPSYDSVKDAKGGLERRTSVGGWTGFTDQYWLVALLPDQKTKVDFFFLRRPNGAYETFVTQPVKKIAAGGSAEAETRVFAGAKKVALLRTYEEGLNIPKFTWAVDFGWFWFFTKPFHDLLVWIFGLVGNFGVAILILTVLVKIVFFPLANKSYKSMSQMKKLQPEMMKLRERYKDDRQKMNQELMGLYKKEKVNPAAGCLPILIQIPVFFALYKVLFVSIEMRHAPFFWWIQDLSARDPTSFINLFGLLPFDAPMAGIFSIISIGVWPIIMGLTMFLQQKLNPAPADPVQAKIFMFLPFIFTFMLASFPAGLVIYWAWNNTLSIGQQWLIMKRHGVYQSADKGAVTNVKDLEAKRASEAANDADGDAADTSETDEAAAEEKPAAKPKPAAKRTGGGNRQGAKGASRGKTGGTRAKTGGTRQGGSRSGGNRPRGGGGRGGKPKA